jgi:hypothetical protein
MKKSWVKIVMSALYLGLAGVISIFAISGKFQLNPEAVIGYFIGLFVLAVILVFLLRKKDR